MKKVMIAFLAASLLAACGNKADRDDARIAKREARLARETAFSLGVEPSSVSIANVSGNMYGYRWQATTGGRTYNCSMVGGSFVTWGQTVTPPDCKPISGGPSKPTKPTKKAKKK